MVYRVVLALLMVIFSIMPVYAGSATVMDKVLTNEKIVALTLENLGSGAELEAAISICKEQDIHVTFFVASQILQVNSILVKRAVDQGNEFGNYGVNHQYWGEWKEETIAKELTDAGMILQKLTGTAAGSIRPPYQYYEDNMI